MGIYRSLKKKMHECGNWECGRAIPFLGLHKPKFLCSVGQGGAQWKGNKFSKIAKTTFVEFLILLPVEEYMFFTS